MMPPVRATVPRAAAVLDPAADVAADEDHADGDLERDGGLRLGPAEGVRALDGLGEDAPGVDGADGELDEHPRDEDEPTVADGCGGAVVPNRAGAHEAPLLVLVVLVARRVSALW